jgi:rhodanese-related sulfurtransferase
MRISLFRIFKIILVSILISLVYNHFNPNGLNLIRQERVLIWEDSSALDNSEKETFLEENNFSSSNQELTHNEMNGNFDQPKAIKLEFAQKLFNQNVKFIDARTVEEFAEGHIKGAINIPFYGSEEYESVLAQIAKDEFVVTYCDGDDCDLSILLGDELFQKGYKKVYVFYGGWKDWLKNNLPVER